MEPLAGIELDAGLVAEHGHHAAGSRIFSASHFTQPLSRNTVVEVISVCIFNRMTLGPACKSCADCTALLEKLDGCAYVYPVIVDGGISDMLFAFGDEIVSLPSEAEGYADFVKAFYENENIKKYTYNSKYLHRLAAQQNIECKGVCGDLMLSAYLLKPSDNKYDIEHLCLEYGVSLPKADNPLGGEDANASYASVLKPLFVITCKFDTAGEFELRIAAGDISDTKTVVVS